MGRSDDMLIIRGVNVFPSQIETVLLSQGFPANYQILVDRVNNTDTFEVQVEMTPELFSDTVTQISSREEELVTLSKPCWAFMQRSAWWRLRPLPAARAKPVRVVDKRKLY